MTDATVRPDAPAAPERPRWSRTVEIDPAAAGRLLAAGDMCWLAPDVELAGIGVAHRSALSDHEDRAEAGRVVTRLLGGIHDDGDPGAPGPVAFASLTFDPDAPGSVILLPRTTVRRHGDRAWLTVVRDQPPTVDDLVVPDLPRVTAAPQRVRYAGTTAAEIAWIDAVDRAVRRIRAGEVEKVVLARDRVVYSDEPIDPTALVMRLRDRFPTCFTFRVDGLVGASPELLIRRADDRITSVVLAGTAPRGATDADDAVIGRALLGSAKDLAEHRPAVDSVRAALAPVTSHLDIDASPHLLRLANVQHLATGVSGTLSDPADALSLAQRLHPTAAVGGMPADAALAMIAELETIDRGRYAGPVGWMDAAGDGEFAIALRCAQLDTTTARLFAGAGIVADSLPESELEETRLKLRAMQSAFGATP